jgi:hypothetical protein
MRYVTVVLLCLAACGGAPSPDPPSSRTALYGADAGRDGASVDIVVTCWDRTAATDSGLIQVPCECP